MSKLIFFLTKYSYDLIKLFDELKNKYTNIVDDDEKTAKHRAQIEKNKLNGNQLINSYFLNKHQTDIFYS